MKRKRRRVKVDLDRLDNIVESTRERTLEDQERATLRTALHEMAAYIGAKNNTEKTRAVDRAKGPRPPKEREKRKKPAGDTAGTEPMRSPGPSGYRCRIPI